MATATPPAANIPSGVVLSSQQLLQEVLSRSYQDNVDPAAAWAVAAEEGGHTPAPGHYDPDTHGNPGWSYGPFQLRDPGALPISSSGPSGPGYKYAWSKEGVDYAIDQIAKVAEGRTGSDAITQIVTRFERPANPAGEIARAEGVYAGYVKGGISATGPGGTITPSGPGATNPGGVIGGAAGALGVVDSIGKALSVLFSLRGLEMLSGFVLIILGVLWMARRQGLNGALPGR